MYIPVILLFLAGIAAVVILRNTLIKSQNPYSIFDRQDHFRPGVNKEDFFEFKGYELIRAMVMPLKNLIGESIQPEVTLKRFSPEQKALYFWWMMDGEVNTGGFAKYFESEEAKYLTGLKAGLKLIGDDNLVSLLAKAEKIDKKKHKSAKGKREPLELNSRRRSEEFAEADRNYSTVSKNTLLIFEELIKSSPSLFCTDEEGRDIDPHFTGIIKIYFESDTIREEIPVVDGLIEGERKTWYEDGQPFTVQTWSGGRQTGDQKAWYSNGQLRFSETYSDGGLLVENWYPDGKKEKEERYNSEKLLHGTQKKWYDNGVLAEEITYQVGNPHGPFLQYYDNASRKLEAEFENGNVIYRNFWNEKGKQLLRDGTGIYIFQPATSLSVLRREIRYKDYKKEGLTREFMDNTLISSTAYHKDKKHGKAILFYDDGSVKQEAIYENGELISTKDFPPAQKAIQ